MNKRLMVLVLLVSLVGLFVGGNRAVNQMRATFASEGGSDTYLPIVVKPPPTPTPVPLSMESVVKNNSFEDTDWTDLPRWPANQQPTDWVLTWVDIGELLYDSDSDRASAFPECSHKLSEQLPPEERLGGVNALILEGNQVYKIFGRDVKFGAELKQTVSGLTPGSYWRLIVPIQVHLHEDPDPYAAESGVWVNGQGQWVNGADMGDRQWYEHVVYFTVPADGKAVITIRVKSKWPARKDFFIDFLH